jgi:uncharacterized protein YjbJ (UPF0337 family)
VQHSDFAAALEHKFDQGKAQVVKALGNLKDHVDEAVDKTKQSANDFKDHVGDAVDKAKQQAGKLKDKVDEAIDKAKQPAGNLLNGQAEASDKAAPSKAGNSPAKGSTFGDQNDDPGNPLHVSAGNLASVQALNAKDVQPENDLKGRLGDKGDFLDPGGGTNTVIGAGANDIIAGNTEGSFNTVTTGPGKDLVLLGKGATNRVFDFDPGIDQLGLAGLKPQDILFGQGKNPETGGLNQPLDSTNNTVVIDKNGDHILASLAFVDSGAISSKDFVTVNAKDLASVTNLGNSANDAKKGTPAKVA